MPHVGGPLSAPGAPMVRIGGKPAIVVGDGAVCAGAPDAVREGAPMVRIGGVPMARKGDATVHGGVILEGHPMVIVGGAAAPTTDAEAIEDAMNIIRTSELAKTEEGKKVLARLEDLHRNGDIRFRWYLGEEVGTRASHGEGKVWLAQEKNRDPEYIASELVHEGTHDLDEQEHVVPYTESTIDEEVRTTNNQLDLYEEQRRDGYKDEELEDRRDARSNGTLREHTRKREPGLSEH